MVSRLKKKKLKAMKKLMSARKQEEILNNNSVRVIFLKQYMDNHRVYSFCSLITCDCFDSLSGLIYNCTLLTRTHIRIACKDFYFHRRISKTF